MTVPLVCWECNTPVTLSEITLYEDGDRWTHNSCGVTWMHPSGKAVTDEDKDGAG